MTKKAISPGAAHSVPADLRKILISDPAAWAKWENITPLARNEWICRVISVKKPETRRQHIERVRTELKEGMRRPCCRANRRSKTSEERANNVAGITVFLLFCCNRASSQLVSSLADRQSKPMGDGAK